MHGSLGKKLIGAATAVITAVCTISSSLPAVHSAFKQEEYLAWSQLDERWGETPMGETNVRRSGCLVTALSIMIVDSGSLDEAAMKNLNIEKAEDFNPGVLADGYTSIEGFSEGGAIKSWLDIQKLVPSVQWGYDSNLKSIQRENEDDVIDKTKVAEELQSLIENGWYIIARVMAPYGGYHWVYIRGISGDEIYMSDPANINPLLYEVYPEGLHGEYWALRGANSPEIEFVPPVQFEPHVDIEEVTPPKTMYAYGEQLDLSECMIKRKGQDPTGADWEEEPVLLTESENVSHSVYFYPEYPGEYDLSLWTQTDYAYGNTSIKLTVSQPAGEYYLPTGARTKLYSSELGGEPITTIASGEVVKVTECYGNLGKIDSKDSVVWADVSKMTHVPENVIEHAKGDIDGDGYIDKYDLAQLSIYLKNKSSLKEGISLLTSAESKAADMNSDGIIDEADFIALLSSIQ